jgi:hypothetical protein
MQQTATTKRPQTQARTLGFRCITFAVLYKWFYIALTNLQFTLKFICRFIIKESAFCGNEVENSVVVTVVADMPTDQLGVSYHASYVWPPLNQKFPLVFNPVHVFLSRSLSPKNLIYDFPFPFPFISWSTTFTISRNSSLVNIPFSTNNLVRASCYAI